MHREVLLALGERDGLHLLVRPVAREGGLDLGEDAETVERTRLELFESDVILILLFQETLGSSVVGTNTCCFPSGVVA